MARTLALLAVLAPVVFGAATGAAASRTRNADVLTVRDVTSLDAAADIVAAGKPLKKGYGPHRLPTEHFSDAHEQSLMKLFASENAIALSAENMMAVVPALMLNELPYTPSQSASSNGRFRVGDQVTFRSPGNGKTTYGRVAHIDGQQIAILSASFTETKPSFVGQQTSVSGRWAVTHFGPDKQQIYRVQRVRVTAPAETEAR